MKLLKKLGLGAATLTLSAMFVIGGTNYVNARSLGYKIGAATVDDVTTTVCVSAGGALRGFGNGVSMDQVWALEKEVGAKGSGAWVAIPGYTDIFPTANGAAAVGGPTQLMDYASPDAGCYRLRMTTDGGGTGQIQLVGEGNASTPESEFTKASHNRQFDDFQHGTVPITTTHNGDTPSYLVFMSTGNGAVIPVIEGEGEGALTYTSGDGGSDDADLSVWSLGLITNGALVSDGLTVMEVRASMSQITDTRVNFGLVDRIQAATEEEHCQLNTNVVTEGAVGSHANSISFVFDTDSYDAGTDSWNMCSLNANTLGNVADEYDLLRQPVAQTYARLRIEVDSAGHGYMYFNDELVGVEPLAVATTAVLIPSGTVSTPDDGTGTAGKIYVDYLLWYVPRPTTAS